MSQRTRCMGIDPGLRRVGIALSDEEREWASPLKTLLREKDDTLLLALVEEAKAHGVSDIVMGLPLRMNGTTGPEAKRAELLGRALQKASGIKVVMWDERFTTVSAERELRGSGLRGNKKKALIDQAAATVLLQSYLDAQRSRHGD